MFLLLVYAFFLNLKGGLKNGWISKRVRPVFRLWFALVGSFVESPFFQKRPAIKTIEPFETVEMCPAPLAGDSLRRGARVGGRVGDRWNFGFFGLGRRVWDLPMVWDDFLKCHPCFVDRAPLFFIYFSLI